MLKSAGKIIREKKGLWESSGYEQTRKQGTKSSSGRKLITCTSWTPTLERIIEVRGVIQEQVIGTSWITS